MIRYLVFIFFIIFTFLSCKKEGCTDSTAENFNPNANTDDGTCTYLPDLLRINVNASFGSQDFFLDSIYQTDEGHLVKFTDLKFFITDLKNGTDTLIDAALYDYRETQNTLFNSAGDFLKFESLTAKIGIDSSINHDDPSMFPNDSPLNITNAGLMHWGWNTGYIFISIEGKVDTLSSGNNFNHNFSFHVGTDQFLDSVAFDNLTWSPTSDGHKLDWSLDLKTFLNNPLSPIDLKNEFLTHSGSGQLLLAEKVKNNFLNALTP